MHSTVNQLTCLLSISSLYKFQQCVYITNPERYNFASRRQAERNIQMRINKDKKESLWILFTSARCLLKGDEYCIKSHVPTGKLLEPWRFPSYLRLHTKRKRLVASRNHDIPSPWHLLGMLDAQLVVVRAVYKLGTLWEISGKLMRWTSEILLVAMHTLCTHSDAAEVRNGRQRHANLVPTYFTEWSQTRQ